MMVAACRKSHKKITVPVLPDNKSSVNDSAPFISVIIPALNDLEHLPEGLAAMAKQSYPTNRFELIVVDNGSAEPPRELVESFSFYQFANERQAGSYAARNCGLELMRGELMAFTEADCKPNANSQLALRTRKPSWRRFIAESLVPGIIPSLVAAFSAWLVVQFLPASSIVRVAIGLPTCVIAYVISLVIVLRPADRTDLAGIRQAIRV
jgi:glycosyltransferase involved in cell wall biosynthesis